ncbi:MAG: hypothetical protein PHY73_02790 [Candidatus Omnitrophica bacterium]|nr:hypothetical protein [Candidatus Omnitrophota bacterium]
MKKFKIFFNWQVWFGISLLMFSAFVYYIHYLIFHDAHHIFIYLIGDIAFVFIEVLLVTLILHQVLSRREKRLMLNKLNMLIGIFFSEVGTELLRKFIALDKESQEISDKLSSASNRTLKEFSLAVDNLKHCHHDIDITTESLVEIKKLLASKRDFLANLLANPNMLEHDAFTGLLWSVFHLMEELLQRKDLALLPKADYAHIASDIDRVYRYLVSEWIEYMKHLKKSYPYLFSLALRANPFDPNPCVEIT